MVCYFDLPLLHNVEPIKVRCCLRSSVYTYQIEARYGSIRYRLEPDEERILRLLLVKTDADEHTTTALALGIWTAMTALLGMTRVSRLDERGQSSRDIIG